MTPALPPVLFDVDFKESFWNRKHAVWADAVNPADYVSTSTIQQQLEASLLRWPYFTLLNEGEQPPTDSYTLTRNVIGQKRSGFPNSGAIYAAMDQGASLKMNQVGDWHRGTRRMRADLETAFPVAVSSYVFWTPREQRGMRPHRDAAHVLAVQLEGSKEWELYADPDQVGQTAGLDVDSARPTHTIRLDPGDVLYLPHGWPHAARAVDGPSMHLTFTLLEPTAADLVEGLLAQFEVLHPDLVVGFHRLLLSDRSAAVLAALRDDVVNMESGDWATRVLESMRELVG